VKPRNSAREDAAPTHVVVTRAVKSAKIIRMLWRAQLRVGSKNGR
jgi:hypothetical protein